MVVMLKLLGKTYIHHACGAHLLQLLDESCVRLIMADIQYCVLLLMDGVQRIGEAWQQAYRAHLCTACSIMTDL